MRGLLLLGTDTGVGKTTVAEGLLRLAARRGFRLVPFKPVETGCSPDPGDALRLCNAAAMPGLKPTEVCPIALQAPIAPSAAARLENRSISPTHLAAHGRDLAHRGDALLIETAGGVLTPYGVGLTSASLAELFDIDVLLVAANRLGTINHTALALAEIQRRALRLVGLVLVNLLSVPTPDQPSNASEILALTGVPYLGTLRHCPVRQPDVLADAAAADLDLRPLLSGALR